MDCTCGNHHPIDMEIVIENGAISKVSSFLKERRFERAMLIVDPDTNEAAGKKVGKHLKEANIWSHLCILPENHHGDVVADEATIQFVTQEMPTDVDVFLAVGSGTIHDIVRFVSHQAKKPFVSVPTAASVDGFTSAGAPLIIDGNKVTVQASAPIAVFADVDVLCAAPPFLAAAGFSDMLGKYTSLVDWQFSHLMAGEPFCPTAYQWTRQALENCVNHLDDIRDATKDGMTILMQSLIRSGLAMMYVGHSRPASGAEHHLSHFWEVAFLQEDRPQVLHGEKVGVATVIVADLYKRMMTRKELEQIEKIVPHLEQVKQLVEQIPQPEELREMLEHVGSPAYPEVLGISPELVEKALREAHHIRDRETILRFVNENKLFDLK